MLEPALTSLYELELKDLPAPSEREGYRRKQLANWLYLHGAEHLDEMTNLPKVWREQLAERYQLSPFASYQRFVSKDLSVRYLFTLADGKQTEAVYMPYENRKTLCISSMVGCPAGCAFCATGALGFGRNLARAEILAQILVVAQAEGFAPREIRNVVLMGMGEALLNYDNAIGAIRTMIDPEGLDMSPRRITLSTVGLAGKIRRLAEEDVAPVLALSLHAPDDETRQKIIPTAHAHSVADIMAAVSAYQAAKKRRITIEYTMLAGVNDALWQAGALAELLAGLRAHVNLIPFNPWPGSGFRSSPEPQITAFRQLLERANIPVSVRFSRGRDAGGACGQLALSQRGTSTALPVV